MDREQRLEAFEVMLREIQRDCQAAGTRMGELKAQGKERSATYRQLMGNKLTYQNMLALYRAHGLLEGE